MDSTVAIALGIAVGALGACAHVASAWGRARLAVEGHAGIALATYPLALALVGALLFALSRLGPEAVWAAAASLLITRALLVTRARAWASR